MELHSWPQPCSVMYCRHLFASRLALESLFSEQQGQWYRSPASLWARTAISTWGKPTSIAQGCNRFARERDLTNTYPKGVVPSGLLELLELTRARSIQSPRPHAALCTMSAWGLAGDHVPWAAARDLFSGRWVFAGFAGSPGHQPGVRARLLMPLCPGRGLSQSSVLTHHFYGVVSATSPKDCYALPTLVVAVSSPASYCHGPDVFNLCWEIFLYLPAPFSPLLLLSVYLYRARV